MKKTTMILLIAGFFIFYSSAVICQNYYPLVETNKVWNISYYYTSPPAIMKYIKFEGDSVIGPNSYKKVLQTADSNSYPWSQIGLIRETTDHKVYYVANFGFSEHLMYDFNMNQHDTTYLWSLSYPFIADSVDSVQVLTGEYRKRITITTPTFPGHDQWIEGVGSVYGVLFSVEFVLVGETDTLICMTRNDTLVYHDTLASTCDSPYQGIAKETKSAFSIYPDPVRSDFTLGFPSKDFTLKEPVTLSIFNSIGEKIKILQVDHNKALIHVADLPSGIYFIRLNASDISGSSKFVKE